MIYLSGGHPRRVIALQRPDLGAMLTPMMGHIPDAELRNVFWAADTGCFAQPERYSLERYLGYLSRLSDFRQTCLFATAPDVVGDAAATWDRSKPVLPILRTMGYPAALVAQNGIEDAPIQWDAFDCLFIGGDDAFKLAESTYALVREANRRGKWTHMGRVNGWPRIRAAAVGGYDSSDGTKIAFGPDVNLPRVLSWLDRLGTQQRMEAA